MAMGNTWRRKNQNDGGKNSNHPPPQKGIGGGETSNRPTQREIGGGETPNKNPLRDIGGEETSNPPSPRDIEGAETPNPPARRDIVGGREEIGVTIDPDLLNCSICTNPLCPPLYQCTNGHVTCYSCWSKVQYKCPSCDKPIGAQNIALEKVLESIHLSCPNANFGCSKSVSYSQMQVHTDMCEFGPSLCPIPGCAHMAFSGEWRGHFLKDHWISPHYNEAGSRYSYGESCPIVFHKEDLYYSLLGPGKDLFLLVKEPIPNVGNALSIYYIDLPDRGQNVFPYELEVIKWENNITTSVQFKSQAVSIKEWKRGEVRGCGRFLLLPLEFRGGNMKIHVLINKKLYEEWE